MANTNSNGYTFGYAAVMTLIVAVALAGVSMGLKPMQDEAMALDKKMQILNAVTSVTDKAEVTKLYGERVTEVVINEQGKEVQGAVAFDIEMKKEYRKPSTERKLPLYIYKEGSKTSYIMPLHGAGLWDEIWGFVALDGDLNTVVGTTFDHKGETPGLGAEISKPWFQDQFKGKKLADNGQFKLKVLKGKGNPIDGKPYDVDGMSGATITGDGIQDMIAKGYKSYLAYFKQKKS